MTRRILPAVLGLLLFLAILQVWNIFAPVTLFMNASEWTVGRNYVQARVRGYKIHDCAVVKNSFVGWAKVDGDWREVPFEFPNDTTPNSSKPMSWQRQSFGMWRWGKRLGVTHVRMTAQHMCGDNITTSTFGPFTVPKASAQK